MSVDAHTVSLLYRYLRMLSVRVGRGTVARLLAHPLGNSMRGLSDGTNWEYGMPFISFRRNISTNWRRRL